MRKAVFIFLLVLAIPLISLAATYGPTKNTDHLWRIAMKMRPNKTVSIEQVMVAILHNNSWAFLKNNVNGLKVGEILTIPDIEKIRAVLPQTAIEIIRKQNQAWLRAPAVIAKKIPSKTSTVAYLNLNQISSKQKQYDMALSNLQNQFYDVNSNMIQFQQKITAKILQYETMIESLVKEINKNQQQLTSIEAKINTLERGQKEIQAKIKSKDNFILDYAKRLHQTLGNTGAILLLIAVILLLILLLRLICPRRRKVVSVAKSEKTPEAPASTEAEYDFMGSAEGIPAKLDLARAYIDMGDKDAAKTVLDEIINIGNDEQRQAAQDLLAKLSS